MAVTAVVRPPALRPGDVLAVVSPSWAGPAELPAPFERGLDMLTRLGFRIVVGKHARGTARPWTSATARERAGDINSAFADPSVAAVLCSIGGNHSAQTLPYLDFTVIAENPKVFCGYSDATVLHHAIAHATGLVTFYGPAVIPQWGAVGGPMPYTVEHFRRVVARALPAGAVPRASVAVHDRDFGRAEQTGVPLRRTTAAPRTVLRPGRAEGQLSAACLPSVRHLVGTEWEPSYRGRILVLETPGPPYSVADADADLTHLLLAAILDDLAALVLCRPYGFSAEATEALQDVVMEHLRQAHIPVLAGFEGGHTDPLPTLPLGTRAVLDGDELYLTEAAVAPPDRETDGWPEDVEAAR